MSQNKIGSRDLILGMRKVLVFVMICVGWIWDNDHYLSKIQPIIDMDIIIVISEKSYIL